MICPYCGSENTDFVDEDRESEHWVCRDCGDDFVVWDDGEVTDRHNSKIND